MKTNRLRIIIAGGRDFADYAKLEEKVTEILEVYGYFDDPSVKAEIVSGCAKGADSLGERYAKERKIPVKKFPADWNRYGNAAGPIRNEQMAAYAGQKEYQGILIAFWDEKSRGTRNMISNAEKYHLFTRIVKY